MELLFEIFTKIFSVTQFCVAPLMNLKSIGCLLLDLSFTVIIIVKICLIFFPCSFSIPIPVSYMFFHLTSLDQGLLFVHAMFEIKPNIFMQVSTVILSLFGNAYADN